MKPATRAVHAGTQPPHVNGLAPALYQSSVFYARTVSEAVELEDMSASVSSYSRTANPTTSQFESAMAELEGAEQALATPSGMAALTLTLLTLLTPRDLVAVSPHSYADTLEVLTELSRRVGFEVLVENLDEPGVGKDLRRRNVTCVVVESPSNPMLRTVDIAALAEDLRGTEAKIIVDSTMATPVNQQPLRLGADLVIHSASKYLAGHHQAIAGVIAGGNSLLDRLRYMRTITGICLDPNSAWLLSQGLKTLDVRVRTQNATAQAVAEFLHAHPEVDFVAYPGLPDSASAEVATRQMTGFGGVLTFGLAKGPNHIADFLESLSLCTIAVSLGGFKTLIESPALMSHVQGGPENASLTVIPDNAVRLSVGLEDSEDIIDDLRHGLALVATSDT